ncbi:hypothetical protein [Kineosporia sp. R_H_3]|uniref:hypothetical protein n=1 Tax=Kineosporia sp. R_H_3 TaxID=1961848 RepID=UPI000B4B9B29|nr:hypothetical protein [Kineosporia sp. R_H_3]
MADAAEQATIPGYRVTSALAALGQVLGARLTVKPAAGLDVATSPELQGFRDACSLLNADAVDVLALDFGAGYVQVTTRRPDSDDPVVLTLEVVDA